MGKDGHVFDPIDLEAILKVDGVEVFENLGCSQCVCVMNTSMLALILPGTLNRNSSQNLRVYAGLSIQTSLLLTHKRRTPVALSSW